MNFKAVIFDLDGTVLDSMSVWRTLGEKYLLSKGLQPEAGLFEKLRHMSLRQSAEYFRSAYGVTDGVPEIINDFTFIMEYFYANQVQLKPGVHDLMSVLHQNHVRMCVTTATERKLVSDALRNNGIYDYFDFIITCSETGFDKDKPDIYLQALQRLGLPQNEVCICEDALYAIETAKAAGFHVIAMKDDAENDHSKKIEELADLYIESFDELIDKWG